MISIRLRLIVALLLVCSVAPFTTNLSYAQDRAQIESAVKGMSQAEIDRRLRELGMTREDAIARARENGLNVEDYLKRFQAFTPSGDTTTLMPSMLDTLRPWMARFDTLRHRKIEPVRGFSHRLGRDSLLQPFGYEVFEYPASTFIPVINVATPPSYILGPGDELVVSVWGDTKLYYQLTINRDGNLVIPDVGPVVANGLTIQQLRDRLIRRLTQAYSGLRNGAPGASTFLDVSLGRLRTIQVFVLGDVVRPGGYAVSSMSTAFLAVYLAGGPTVSGTLRNVQIIRNGEKVPDIDLYDYLLRGDRTKDTRLQDGDVVFVRPVGKRVAVTGRVARPAIYEIRDKETLGSLVNLAGGLTFDSYFNRIHVQRIIPFDQRQSFERDVLETDLEFKSIEQLQKSAFVMEDGDIVSVPTISEIPQNRVTIGGSVKHPGVFEWKPGMRVKDLILRADSLERNTFSERGTLFRLLPSLRREVYPFNPRLALADDPAQNLTLKNEDSLVVYKESQFFPERSVVITGAVHNPGTYVRYDKMTVGDLVVLAGGVTEAASSQAWEVARIDTTQLGVFSRIFKLSDVDQYWNDANGAKFELEDFDQLTVPFNPKYTEQKSVLVAGYVMYPGSYAIKGEDERIADMIRRAGGLKDGAYLEGSRLIRKANGAGLVPISLQAVIDNPQSPENIRVTDGDSIYIAYRDNVVYVRGQVFVPSAVVYKQGASLAYYIHQAGGYREDADESKTVVTLPNGRKWEPGWFIFPNPDIQGGSSITVPQKIEKPDNTLQVISNFATVLASLAAITVAIVQVTK